MSRVLQVLLVLLVLVQVRLVVPVRLVHAQDPSIRSPRQLISLRFHHLHYRVADPLTSMKAAGDTANGPEILPGIGVGVRIGGEFLLFERSSPDSASSPAAMAITATMYTAIVDGLRSHGLAVPIDPAPYLDVLRRVPGMHPDHIAFSTPDWLGAVASLERSGVKVTKHTDVSATFRLSARGPLVEIVRDPDEPDVYWCAMHPDVRSPAPGTCPICKMALVPIPPPRIGEYRVDVTAVPAASGGGLRALRLGIRDPESGAAVTSLATVHERPLHLFVVGRGGEYFAHLHPEPGRDGTFEVQHAIPAGEYMVVADFLPQGGTPQMAQHALITPGFDPPPAASAPLSEIPTAMDAAADGVRARADSTTLAAGRTGELRFVLTQTQNGRPVTDLQPYLAAPGHLFVASRDLTFAVHGHPSAAADSGPELSFALTLPAPGQYLAWLQVQRRGRVVTLPFVVDAR